MDPELNGRTALVTGGSGAIGAAIACGLGRAGARVGVHWHSGRAAAEDLLGHADLSAVPTHAVQADLTSETSTSAMFDALEQTLGPVDTLICNAGSLVQDPVALVDMTLAQWQTTLARNLTSQFLTLRRFLEGVRAAGVQDPAIVLIGSMSGVWGQPGHVDYAAAKAGLLSGVLPTIKDELIRIAPQGRVNAIAPGFVLTPMIDEKLQDSETMARVLQTASLKKFATVEDVANLALFLASNHLSGHMTGESIRLAGGKEGRVLFDLDQIEVPTLVGQT